MHEEVIISGFGGQGVMLAGKFIAYLGMEEAHHVTYIPSYGAEVRGGTANCTVIISEEEIASPLSSRPYSVLAMNKPSLRKFSPRLIEKGTLFMNSSLIDEEPGRKDIKVIKVPANELAEKEGNIRCANMAMLGAYLAVKKLVPAEKACRLMKDVIPERWHNLLDVNRRAFLAGDKYIKSLELNLRPT